MQIAKLYRVILALCVAVLSTASAMHDIVHHGHGHEDNRAAYSASTEHESHADGGCEFCAKGPTVSTESPSLTTIARTSADEAPQVSAEEVYIRASVRLRSLRGPPTA